MSANLGLFKWGGGCVARSAPGGEGGNAAGPMAGGEGGNAAGPMAGGVTDDALEGLSAKEAVASLDLPGAADKLDLDPVVTFPGPMAEAYYWSDDDVVAIQGPVGSGKTTTKNKRKLRRAIMMPRSKIDGVRRYKVLYIRETYRQLWSTTIPSYLEQFPKSMGTWSGGRGDPVTHVIRFDDGHGEIEFVAEFMAFGDDIIASMRGIQATDIDLNEADTMPVEILTVGIGRIDRWPAREHFAGLPEDLRSYGQIDCDFNAPDEDNWTFRVFHDAEERMRIAAELTAALPQGTRPITIEFFNQPGYGQPGAENLQNLSPAYYPRQIASMKLAGRGDMIDRLVYNKVVYLRVGEPVFKREFNRRVHVSDGPLDIIQGEPLRIGLDQGLKGAAVVCQFVPPFHWRVYAEMHFPQERLLAKVFGNRLRDLLDERFFGLRIEAGWGDMAGEHGASEAADENDTWNRLVAQSAGFAIRPQRLGTNRISPRLEAVRAALEYLDGGQPGLLIDPSCKMLIRGFEARYVWTDAVNASGDKRKIPDKSFTEANVHDALQYVALSEHRADGISPNSFPDNRRGRMGHNGGPPLSGMKGGLQTGHDVLNPYGGR
ncbi:hypothetical protein [Oceaniglobus trochenteri]|uniref:hypothetical protein n=1 Tax=Oceaniglobus trochenteri TaxID=2763260 RepID=UPI001CFFDB39|nr:hypothetical protein [Oceaniglobus trochenteri]